SAIEQAYQWVEKCAKALREHPKIITYFVKIEIAQGRQMPDKSPSVLIHVHADIMLAKESDWSIVSKCLPPELKQRLDQPVYYSTGWFDYLGKPYIARPADNQSRDVLKAIAIALDQFQKQTRVSKLFWVGGWYDRRTSQQIVRGAGIAKA